MVHYDALTCAVVADDAEHFAWLDVEVDKDVKQVVDTIHTQNAFPPETAQSDS